MNQVLEVSISSGSARGVESVETGVVKFDEVGYRLVTYSRLSPSDNRTRLSEAFPPPALLNSKFFWNNIQTVYCRDCPLQPWRIRSFFGGTSLLTGISEELFWGEKYRPSAEITNARTANQLIFLRKVKIFMPSSFLEIIHVTPAQTAGAGLRAPFAKQSRVFIVWAGVTLNSAYNFSMDRVSPSEPF